MDVSLCLAAGGEIGDQGRADVRTPAAAVFEKEQRHLAEAGEVRAIDDRAALSLSAHEPCARKNAQVRGHSVLRHGHEAREFPRRNAVRLSCDEQAKGIEPRSL